MLDGWGVAATLVVAVLSEGTKALAGAVGGVIPDLESLARLGNPTAQAFPEPLGGTSGVHAPRGRGC